MRLLGDQFLKNTQKRGYMLGFQLYFTPLNKKIVRNYGNLQQRQDRWNNSVKVVLLNSLKIMLVFRKTLLTDGIC